LGHPRRSPLRLQIAKSFPFRGGLYHIPSGGEAGDWNARDERERIDPQKNNEEQWLAFSFQPTAISGVGFVAKLWWLSMVNGSFAGAGGDRRIVAHLFWNCKPYKGDF
jgi:hypothetical protein